MEKATDKQIGGSHYKNFKIQPSKFIYDNGIKFNEGNIIKYVCRHEFKNGLQDLEKAGHYVDLLMEFSENSVIPFLLDREFEFEIIRVGKFSKFFCEENQLDELQSAIILNACLFSKTNAKEYLYQAHHFIKKLIEQHYG